MRNDNLRCRTTSPPTPAGKAQQLDEIALADTLVELETHALPSTGTGTIHWRVTSAPYPMVARTSSWVSDGFSRRISSSVVPLAG